MVATSQNVIRTIHPTMSGVFAAFIMVPVLILVTWPAASMLGDARMLLVEFIGVPILCCFGLTHILHINSFEFRDDSKTVQIQARLLLIAIGEPVQIPFQTITNLDWQDDGEGCDLSMMVAENKRYYVTMSQSKARQISKMVLQKQPNLKPNLHPHLI